MIFLLLFFINKKFSNKLKKVLMCENVFFFFKEGTQIQSFLILCIYC